MQILDQVYESIRGLVSGRKSKARGLERESNPRPSVIQIDAITTKLPRPCDLASNLHIHIEK